jgi:hypothetical protein
MHIMTLMVHQMFSDFVDECRVVRASGPERGTIEIKNGSATESAMA